MRTLSGNDCQEVGDWSCTVMSGVCRDSLFQFKAGGVGMQIDDREFFVTGITYIQKSKHHILVFLFIKHVMQNAVRYPWADAFLQHSTTPHAHNLRLLKSNPPIMTLSSIQSIGNSRSLTLKQTSIIHSSTSNTTKDWHKQRDYKVKPCSSENFTSVDECREDSGAKVTSWVDSLANLSARG
jgi:hypothetical protein